MRGFLALLVTMCILHVSRLAGADGIAVPAGSFVRIVQEKSLVVWDAPSKTMHFVHKPSFDGDAASFAFFVPTPVTPVAAKADGAAFDRLRAIVYPSSMPVSPTGQSVRTERLDDVTVTQTVTIDDYELVSLESKNENAIGDWLKAHGYADRAPLRAWMKSYASRGWIINAMRWTGSKDKTRATIEVPAIRLTFHTEQPYYPWSEPSEDNRAKADFNTRWCTANHPECWSRGARRSVETWLVARTQLQGAMDGRTRGPRIARSVRVTTASLAAALGETKAWFDPSVEPTWTITHVEDDARHWGGATARPVSGELVYTAYDLPAPIPMQGVPGWTPPLVPKPTAPLDASPHKKSKRRAVLALALLLALAVLFALRMDAKPA